MKRLKVLGKGVFATTYLVKKGNTKYALKVQKYSDFNKDNIKTELEFVDVAKKYPDQFMVLEEHWFVEKCKENVGLDNIKYPEIKKHKKSNLCINLLYSLKDGTLDNFKGIFNNDILNSFIIQMVFIFYLLEKNNFYHQDIHLGNIGYTKTNKKTIKIFGFDIPTYGYIFSLIDYGSMTRTVPYKGYTDIASLIFELHSWYDCVGQNMLPPFEDVFKLIKKEPEYDIIKKWTKNKYEMADYFCLLNRSRILELLGLPECCIPKVRREFLIYLYSNKKNLSKIIKTLAGKF
jgi:serine/threonine protein kinase